MLLLSISIHRLGYFSEVGRKKVMVAKWFAQVFNGWLESWYSQGSVCATYQCSWQHRPLWLRGGPLRLGNQTIMRQGKPKSAQKGDTWGTSCSLHVPGSCASPHSAGVLANRLHVCLEFLGLHRKVHSGQWGYLSNSQIRLSCFHVPPIV